MAKISTKESLCFGLDIGTRSIVGTVGYLDKEIFYVVAQAVREHETRAMLDGQIHDISAVAATIKEVKLELEKKIGKKLKNVCIAAAGRVLRTENTNVTIDLGDDRTITSDNVYELHTAGVEKAYAQFKKNNKSEEKFYCVGHTPVRYYLNGNPITNLENHKGSKIGLDLIATFLPSDVVEGLYTAVDMAGLEVSNLTLEPIAAITVAIPEKYRMLNIALVDVGAGTSDICLTQDGSITAYGMIPIAGDSLTEAIAKHCLVEFNVAENIKREIAEKEVAEYEDIMGLPMSITRDEVISLLEPFVDDMTTQVSDCIKKLNGDKPVGAIFVVGGGGKLSGYTDTLAEKMGIAVQRVALRGEEVMGKIEFLDNTLKKDSLLVTPIGICLNFYEQNNNFIYITFNDERIKLYDNGNLTIVDALMQAGVANDALFPKRGKELKFILDGEEKIVKGSLGEGAVVTINNENVDLHAPLKANDVIKFKASTKGSAASTTLGKVIGKQKPIGINVDGISIELPRFAMVNGSAAVDSYKIKKGDKVENLDYYTVAQILEFMDLGLAENQYVTVNNEKADMDTKVYDKFSLSIITEEVKELSYADLPVDEEYVAKKEAEREAARISGEESEAIARELVEKAKKEFGDTSVSSIENTFTSLKADSASAKEAVETAETDVSETKEEASEETVEEAPKPKPVIHDITLIVNGKPLTMKGKTEYTYVDVFDYIEIDLTQTHGSGIVTNLNGVKAELFASIFDGDVIDVYWKE